jgi:selenocysteine-specific elongation factor
MLTQCFDTFVEGDPEAPWGAQALLVLAGEKVRVDLRVFAQPPPSGTASRFVQILPAQPVQVFWGETVELYSPSGDLLWGKGKVLDPAAVKVGRRVGHRRLAILEALAGGPKEMLYALVEGKGAKGLTAEEIEGFSDLPENDVLRLAQELESEGRIKILSFTPLFTLAESSFTYLCERLLAHIQKQHQDKPHLLGISPKSLRARFRLPERVQRLALKTLEKDGQVRWWEERVLPAGHRIRVSQEEEEILADLEELSLKGELKRVSLDEIRRKFRLSTAKLDLLLSVLIERNKIVQGQDGFLIHAQWLDELVTQLRALGKSEISIAEFKNLTGLSRKYAIPLLELLDQRGITRRKGSIREILVT